MGLRLPRATYALGKRRASIRYRRSGTSNRDFSEPCRSMGQAGSKGSGQTSAIFQQGHERALYRHIRALKTPKACVAIVAPIRPHERQPEPRPLDEAFPHRSPHSTAKADRALANSLGKRKMHSDWMTFLSVSISMSRAGGDQSTMNAGAVRC